MDRFRDSNLRNFTLKNLIFGALEDHVFNLFLKTSNTEELKLTKIINGYEIGPGAELEGANLIEADLRGSDLYRADLK